MRDVSDIRVNVEQIRNEIAEAALRTGRDPESVRLMAVTKTVSEERIAEAIGAGISLFGENYVQEAKRKIEFLGRPEGAHGNKVEWHMIGSLQSNKAKYAVHLFDLIHSVSTGGLAAELDRRASAAGCGDAGPGGGQPGRGGVQERPGGGRRNSLYPGDFPVPESLRAGPDDDAPLVGRPGKFAALISGNSVT